MAFMISHHDASPCAHHASGATMQSSGQRHTPSATHSASVSGSGGAQPLLTSNHTCALRTASRGVNGGIRRFSRSRARTYASLASVSNVTGLGPELDAARTRVVERDLTAAAVSQIAAVISGLSLEALAPVKQLTQRFFS